MDILASSVVEIVVAVVTLISFPSCTTAAQSLFVGIKGGQPAEPNQFPYQVSIRLEFIVPSREQHFCGGTIYSPDYIITAAHCTFYSDKQPMAPSVMRVVAGNIFLDLPSDPENSESNEQRRNVSSYIIHEGFNISERGSPNDIAILELESPLELNNVSVSSLALPEASQTFEGEAALSGWGSAIIEETSLPNMLETTMVNIISEQQCERVLRGLTESHFCTLDRRKNACPGVSGGPLKCQDSDNEEYLCGISSFTISGCPTGTPSVYTNVSHFVDWIFNIVKNKTSSF